MECLRRNPLPTAIALSFAIHAGLLAPSAPCVRPVLGPELRSTVFQARLNPRPHADAPAVLSETVSVATANAVPDAPGEAHVDAEVDVASTLGAALDERGENSGTRALENERQISVGATLSTTTSSAEPAPGPPPAYPDEELSRGSDEPPLSSTPPGVRSIDPNAAFARMRDAREAMDRHLGADRHLAWLESRVIGLLTETRAGSSSDTDSACVAQTHANSVSLECEDAGLAKAFETRPAELDVFLGRLVVRIGGPGGLRIAFPPDRSPLLSPAP